MPVETERKFLVRNDGWRARARESQAIRQGYLASTGPATVRVRTLDDRDAFITIKSAGTTMSRREYEYPIPIDHARELLDLCGGAVLEKRRHIVPEDGDRWEVDEFSGSLAGLVVAELELRSEDQAFGCPDWLGTEVTGNARYYNSSLVRDGRPA